VWNVLDSTEPLFHTCGKASDCDSTPGYKLIQSATGTVCTKCSGTELVDLYKNCEFKDFTTAAKVNGCAVVDSNKVCMPETVKSCASYVTYISTGTR
jgi:hypothetical protein